MKFIPKQEGGKMLRQFNQQTWVARCTATHRLSHHMAPNTLRGRLFNMKSKSLLSLHVRIKQFLIGCFMIIPLLHCSLTPAQNDFRYLPYLQHPSPDAMTILWFSNSNSVGQLSYHEADSEDQTLVTSHPTIAEALQYPTWEDTTFFNGEAPSSPYKHRIRLENLKPETNYTYTVIQGTSNFSSTFETSPDGNTPIRFIVYADSETEPESTGKNAIWTDPEDPASRKYLIDQTQGYENNLNVIRNRKPDLVIIAGDLVQHGGEQRDWDEFWRHNTNQRSQHSLASQIPILAALGNHEYYEGNQLDRYNQPGSEKAVNKYLSYFEYPANHALHPEQEGRYYSLEYGPMRLIALDVCNNSPNESNEDTNFYLLGENDTNGGFAPDFGPGSRQYQWLERQLAEAQQDKLFTFVVFHHAPYSSGPHGNPPGTGSNQDKQSGVPVRILTPLFMEYGVDAVFTGHDELWERSEISGKEILPDGSEVDHNIHFYDVGIAGDGLRAPIPGIENHQQQFLVHDDVPEVWKDGVLVDGGKHYGHLEVDIDQIEPETWQAILKPVYVFPLLDEDGVSYSRYGRRMYADQITLVRSTK